MSETFTKSQKSEFFDVSAGCTLQYMRNVVLHNPVAYTNGYSICECPLAIVENGGA